MTRLEPFQQLARLCRRKGVENVIICPGSRNAILTVAFTSEPGLSCYSISDERSAAYIALGMSLQTGRTTVIICTSGTAALNFAPAVAEAYFQEVPLLVLTADRPAEWIHQYDGQTIFQEDVYGKHVKKSFSWSADQEVSDLLLAQNVSIEALNLSQTLPKGPVHINIPIREPFYPDAVHLITQEWLTESEEKESLNVDWRSFEESLAKYPKRLLVVGQQEDPTVKALAKKFADKFGFVLVGDSISNVDGGIRNQDIFLKNLTSELKNELTPDFLLTTDMSLISKSLKLFLRESKIKEHWHIQQNPFWIDPFRSLTRKIEERPKYFFQEALTLEDYPGNSEFRLVWNQLNDFASMGMDRFFEENRYSEIHFLVSIFKEISIDSIIHAGNSMSIRYVNSLSKYLPEEVLVFCNRGTSGIDGSLSTAVGQALMTTRPFFCILGDLSFQYDKNALWNSYLPDNLKIIILNNAGGIIFNMIDGPSKQDSFQKFFRTNQPHSAKWIAKEFGLAYYEITSSDEAGKKLSDFLKEPKCAILEFFSDYEENTATFKEYLNCYKPDRIISEPSTSR